MSAVFSAADKWEEPWHESLSNNAKVLYDYLDFMLYYYFEHQLNFYLTSQLLPSLAQQTDN